MEKLRNRTESLSRSFNTVAKFCLLGMNLLIVLNIICRLTPIGPLDGTFEIVGYLGAVLVALALAQNQTEGGNISVKFLISRLPRPAQALADCFAYLVGTILYVVVCWRLVVEATSIYRSGELSPTLSIPFYPIVLVVAMGFLMLGFVLFTDFLQVLKEGLKK